MPLHGVRTRGGGGRGRLEALKRRYERGYNEVEELEALNAELRSLRDADFVDLQCDVMERLTALRAGAAPKLRPPLMLDATLRGVLEDVGCSAPDGRPIHRYALSDERYEAVVKAVGDPGRRGALLAAAPDAAALFCLLVSEWFRRHYAGGVYRWEDPAPAVVAQLPYTSLTALARTGLAWWGRKPKRHAGAELRLVTLVLEGGFPTRLLELNENGRIAAHLRRLTEKCELGIELTDEAVAAMSSTMGVRLGHFDNPDFHALCADLVLAIVDLKRRAQQAAPPGVPLSSYLDATQPDWRGELPITLSGGAAGRLIDELVSAKAQRVGRSEARCRRVLVRHGEDWTPGLRLGVEGPVELGLGLNGDLGRLRLYAAGALASLAAGELAMLEPPGEEGDYWLCRGRGRNRVVNGFPFTVPAEVELRSGERRVGQLTWPRGEALRSELLVFVDAGAGPDGRPAELIFIGGGSLKTKSPTAYLLTPAGAQVRTLDDQLGFAPLWRGTRWLFEVPVSVHVRCGTERYRVDVAADAEGAASLGLHGESLKGCRPIDPYLHAFAGAPRMQLREGTKASAPKAGQVRWRAGDSAIWKDWASQPPREGLIELHWRDQQTGGLIDKARALILPLGARIGVEAGPNGACRYRLLSAPGWRLRAEGGATAGDGETLSLTSVGRPRREQTLEVVAPDGAAAAVACPAPFLHGGFFSAAGELIAENARLMIEDLRGASVVVNRPTYLFVSGPINQHRRLRVEDERALWSVSDEILRLLNGSEGLDDVVRLELGDNSGRRLLVGRYATGLRLEEGSVKFESMRTPLSGDVRLERLSLIGGTVEPIVAGDAAVVLDRTYPVTTTAPGPGLLLLRRASRVIGRPTLHLGPRHEAPESLCRLQACTLPQQAEAREAAFRAALAELGGTDPAAEADRRHLFDLLAAREGAPASAFDVLRALSTAPPALAALAAHAASETERELVWRLERELPFLWCLVPIVSWVEAFANRRAGLCAALIAAGFDREKADAMAGPTVQACASAWVALHPLLETPLFLAGLGGAPTELPTDLVEAARDRIRRLADDGDTPSRASERAPAVAVSCFRAEGSDYRTQLPDLARFDVSQWEGLDAAFAAALAAAGQAQLRRHELLRIRAAFAEEPVSFRDLYAASLMRLARGEPLRC